VQLVQKFLPRRCKKGKETDADEVGPRDDEAVDEDARIEVRTERVRDADAPIELKIDVPEEEGVAEDDSSQQGSGVAVAAWSRSEPREELNQETLANRVMAKKVFDELNRETRERKFSAGLVPDWKSQYEDDA